jgi:hypothetical protein
VVVPGPVVIANEVPRNRGLHLHHRDSNPCRLSQLEVVELLFLLRLLRLRLITFFVVTLLLFLLRRRLINFFVVTLIALARIC